MKFAVATIPPDKRAAEGLPPMLVCAHCGGEFNRCIISGPQPAPVVTVCPLCREPVELGPLFATIVSPLDPRVSFANAVRNELLDQIRRERAQST